MNLEPLHQILATFDSVPPTWEPSPARNATFAELAGFLESQIRPGQPFDLKAIHPNPLWMLLEDRLRDALSDWTAQPAARDGVCRLRQWYSSGVWVEQDGVRLGFDIIPLLRAYEWPDRHDLTHRLADALDALFITHRHQDHYDVELVRACLERQVPVYLPEAVARQWKSHPQLHAIHDGQTWRVGDWHFSARIGPHVWRETVEELPVCIFAGVGSDAQALVYGGDADYTRLPDLGLTVPVKAYFMPWRAPNAAYEPGHELQTGTLPEAFDILIDRVHPAAVLYEHCAELEHVHDGFPASFDLALNLKQSSPVPSELLFWGESIHAPCSSALHTMPPD